MSSSDLEVDVIARSSQRPENRLEAIWLAFETAEGRTIQRPPTHEQRAQVADWLRLRRAHDGIFETFTSPDTFMRKLAHRTPAEKASLLVQGGCDACEAITFGEERQSVLAMHGAINVEPWSAQTKVGKVAIREAVQAKMHERDWHEPVSDQALCLRIVSFVPRSRRRMDVDNLVKGLLDSLQGVLYVNDWQVQCLTSRRVLTRATSGAYLLAAQVVYPYDADVVHDDGQPLNIPFPRIDVAPPPPERT